MLGFGEVRDIEGAPYQKWEGRDKFPGLPLEIQIEIEIETFLSNDDFDLDFDFDAPGEIHDDRVAFAVYPAVEEVLRMRICTHAIVAVGLLVLFAGSAAAQRMAPASVTYTEPDAAAASLAALSNIVYMPVRLAVTTVTAELGGMTAFLNAADPISARDVWRLTEGQAILTPTMYRGDEMVRFGPWQGRMGVLRPREASVQ